MLDVERSAPRIVDRVGDLRARCACRRLRPACRRSGWRGRTCRADRRRAPALTTSVTCTTGTLCSSTIQTGRPFDSVRFSIGGSFSAGGGPGVGRLRAIGRLLRGDRQLPAATQRCASGERRRDVDAGLHDALLRALPGSRRRFTGSTISSTRRFERQPESRPPPGCRHGDSAR